MTTVLLVSICIVFNPINLDTFPSPAKLSDIALISHDLEKYRLELTNARDILKKYASMNTLDKRTLISKWYLKNQREEAVFRAKSYSGSLFGRIQPLTDRMTEVDLAKIDALLMVDNEQPIFHSPGWLRNVYHVSQKTTFSISENISGYSAAFSQSTGTRIEPPTASFERFSMPEGDIARQWILSDFDSKCYFPMSTEKMRSKVESLFK